MSCCGGKTAGGGRSRSRFRKSKRIEANLVKAQMAKNVVVNYSDKILLLRPQFYGVNYSINPWMDVNNKVDRHKALHQWTQLEGTLRRLKVKIVFGKPRRDLPDMVFTANAGFFIKGTEIVVLSNFKHGERKGEEFWFEKSFNQEGYYVRKVDSNFEGAGDCLYFKDKPIGGYGFRTDKSVYKTLVPGVITCELVDPYFYHLDTCYCPLRGIDYLIYPGAFSSEALSKIRNLGGNELTVTEEEAKHFACNAVVIKKNVILPSDCPQTEDMLKQAGYTTFPLPMSEFIKSGGACKCLTLKLP